MGNRLNQLVQQFLECLEIEKNVSALTIRNYGHYLKRFLWWLEKNYPTTLSRPETLNLEIIRKYRLYLARFETPQRLTLKRITQNYHLIAIRALFRYLIRNDIETLAPEKIELPKAETRSLKFLNREQVERLLNMPIVSTDNGLRDKAIMELLFSTGLRVSELVKLNRDQIDVKRGEFGVIGKGRRPRVVFISQSARIWLEKYLQKRDDPWVPLFIRYGGKKEIPGDRIGESFRLTCRSVQRIVEKYVRKAKLPIKITPHGIRHSFATDLLSAGADIRAIQEMLGHKNISTTQIYTHVTNPQLRQIHERFHRR